MGLVARQAFLAISACAVNVASAYPFTHLQIRDAGTDLHDSAYPLVSEDHREFAWQRMISLPEVQVRVAETTRADPNQNFESR